MRIILLLKYIFFTIVIIFVINSSVYAEISFTYTELCEKSENLKLYDEDYWKILLHYKKKLYSYKSLVDSPEFFFSKDGKVDPKAEFFANIDAFYFSSDKKNNASKFPARFKWISQKLNIDISNSESFFTEDYISVRNTLNKITKCSIVFASFYMNKPESVMGHSFFKMEMQELPGLSALSVNYVANNPPDNFFVFGYKGLTGGYPGKYLVLPYYLKVQEYNYLESRDIWEYKLSLSMEEKERMTDHMLELSEVTSNYFFIDENCSYNLLFLLDAARPEMMLFEKASPLVIPIDTIKLLKNYNLIESTTHYPSISTRLFVRSRGMSIAHIDMAESISKDIEQAKILYDNPDLTEKEKGDILDLAIEYYLFKSMTGNLQMTDIENIKKTSFALSRERSRYHVKSEVEFYEKDPLYSHDPFLIGSGLGFSYSRYYTVFRIRPLSHGKEDPMAGYPFGGYIEVFDATFRYYFNNDNSIKKNFDLEKLTIINITSQPKINPLFNPLSWQFSLTVENQIVMPEGKAFDIKFGAGYCGEVLNRFNLYFLTPLGIEFSKKSNFFTGINSGMLYLTKWDFFINTEISFAKYYFNEKETVLYFSNSMVFSMSVNTAIVVKTKRLYVDFQPKNELELSGNFYF